MADEGKSYQEIGDKLHIHRSTVSRIHHKYRKSRNFYHVASKSGRPPKLGPRDVRRAARHLANSTSHDVTDLQRKYFPNISTVTLGRHLKKIGLKAYVRRKRPYISPINRQKRREWAEAHKTWTTSDWKKVIFTDESKFNIFGSDGRQWCWRRPGQEFDDRFVQKTVKHGGGKVMVWGCMTRAGLGRLVRVKGMVNRYVYVDILKSGFLGTLSDHNILHGTYIFQQDNDSKHTSKFAKAWMQDNGLNVLPWPPQSPDMNPIEHVWNEVERRIRKRSPLPHSAEDLWEALQEEWNGFGTEFLEKLYNSMPQRIEDLLKSKGGSTRW